jgi:hypothetical protein
MGFHSASYSFGRNVISKGIKRLELEAYISSTYNGEIKN